MNDAVIREAVMEDLAAILRIYAEAGIGGGVNFAEEESRGHFEVFRRYPYFYIFVAVVDVITGTYELLIMDNLTKQGRKSGIVDDVAVDPNFQHRSIGRAMMEHAREQCRQDRCYKLLFSSTVTRQGAHRGDRLPQTRIQF